MLERMTTISPARPLLPTKNSVGQREPGGAVSAADAEAIARVFKALGDPTRVRLLSLIGASEGGEACICDLIEPVGLTQPTVSHHMKLLVEAGLVTREQRGKWAYFAVVEDAMMAAASVICPG